MNAICRKGYVSDDPVDEPYQSQTTAIIKGLEAITLDDFSMPSDSSEIPVYCQIAMSSYLQNALESDSPYLRAWVDETQQCHYHIGTRAVETASFTFKPPFLNISHYRLNQLLIQFLEENA